MSDHRRTVPLHDRYGAYGRYTWEGGVGGWGGAVRGAFHHRCHLKFSTTPRVVARFSAKSAMKNDRNLCPTSYLATPTGNEEHGMGRCGSLDQISNDFLLQSREMLGEQE